MTVTADGSQQDSGVDERHSVLDELLDAGTPESIDSEQSGPTEPEQAVVTEAPPARTAAGANLP